MPLIPITEIARRMRCDIETAFLLVSKAGGDNTGINEEVWINFLRSFASILTPSKLKGSKGIIICARDDFRCHYCKSNKNLTYDHVIPKSKGGSNRHQNIVIACYDCNQLKGNLSVEEFWEKFREREELRQRSKSESLTTNLKDLLKFKGHVIKFGTD